MNLLVLGMLVAVAVAVPLVITEPSRRLALRDDLLLRDLWAVVDRADGMGRPAVVGADGLRRLRCARRGGTRARSGPRPRRRRVPVPGFPFLLSIVLAAFVTAGLAALIGVGALRVRGLLLAVSTFAFAVAAQQYLSPPTRALRRPDGGAVSPRDTLRARSLVAADLLLRRARRPRGRGRLGEPSAAIRHRSHDDRGRDNADRAAAYTVGPASTKLRAFAVAGFLAGLGGALLAGVIESVPVHGTVLPRRRLARARRRSSSSAASPRRWARCWVRSGSSGYRPSSPTTTWFRCSRRVSVCCCCCSYFPGGFVQIAYSVRDALVAWAARRGARCRRRRARRRRCCSAQVRPPVPTGVPALEVVDVPFASAATSRSTASRSRSARTRSSGSSAPTAPASRPS